MFGIRLGLLSWFLELGRGRLSEDRPGREGEQQHSEQGAAKRTETWVTRGTTPARHLDHGLLFAR
jgi:hypothetical protein